MDDNCLLLDVTTIITLISDTTHRPNELIESFTKYIATSKDDRYYDKIKSITEEIMDELANPLYPKLMKVLEGKKLYTVQEAYDRIFNEMQLIMNVNEHKRFIELTKRLTIIKADISERFQKLDANRWKKSNRSIFGTADKLKVKMLTGNRKAVVTVLDGNKFDMDIIVHRSRDLVGNRILEQVGKLNDNIDK